MFSSIPLANTCSFIDTSPIADNPMLSSCKIKVCYVCEDEPNPNGTSMSKSMLTEMGKTLPGSPIVGFYNEEGQDFEGHKREFEFNDEGEIIFKDMTKAYGYVPENAKVWFEKYLDGGSIEREYLVTEGVLWTGRYSEACRIVEQGNNQSMELHPPSMSMSVSEGKEGAGNFFIVNSAVISALCVLGQAHQPCFDGASITANTNFSLLNSNLRSEFESLLTEIHQNNNNGGMKQMDNQGKTQYAVEIGSGLWNVIYNKIDVAYPGADGWGSKYSIEGVYEEGASKFTILKDREQGTFHRLNFTLTESEGAQFEASLINVTQTFVETTNQYNAAEVSAWENQRYGKNEGQPDNVPPAAFAKDNEDAKKKSSNEENSDSSSSGKAASKKEDDEDDKEKKSNHSAAGLDAADMSAEYSALVRQYQELQSQFSTVQSQLEPLMNFKKAADLKEKQNMIAKFSMLSDDMKADVMRNINNYSVADIEAQLSVLCVRNNVVNFALEQEVNSSQPSNGGWMYSVNQAPQQNANAPSFLADLRQAKSENSMI